MLMIILYNFDCPIIFAIKLDSDLQINSFNNYYFIYDDKNKNFLIY